MLLVLPFFVLLTGLLIFGQPGELLHPALTEFPAQWWLAGALLILLTAAIEARRRTMVDQERDRLRVQKEKSLAELEKTKQEQVKKVAELEQVAADAAAAARSADEETAIRDRKIEQLERALREAETRMTTLQSTSAEGARREEIDAEIVHFLSMLQDKGRFLDFLMDDIAKYPNEQVGAAARLVHQGCRSLIREYFDIAPVHEGREGDAIVLPKEFPAERYKLLGRLMGEPPFKGVLIHAGWRTGRISLPRVVVRERVPDQGSGVEQYHREIITPAEVEVK